MDLVVEHRVRLLLHPLHPSNSLRQAVSGSAVKTTRPRPRSSLRHNHKLAEADIRPSTRPSHGE